MDENISTQNNHFIGYIYKITNKINNKVYIGQTTQSPKERWSRHLSNARCCNSNMVLHSAIRKYGEDNFDFQVICKITTSQKDLDELEKQYIAKYNSCILFGGKGYNMLPGGRGGGFFSTRKDTRVCQLDLNGKLLNVFQNIAIASAETQTRASSIYACSSNIYKTGNGFQWCFYEDLRKKENKKIEPYKKTNKPVAQYDRDGNLLYVWDSIAEANKYYHISNGKISAVCKGRRKTVCNCIWRYAYEEDYSPYKKLDFCCAEGRKVVCLTKDYKVVKIFDSISSAAKALGLAKDGHISSVCKGKRPFAGGFRWKYLEDYYNEYSKN